jgi:integrase
MANRVLDTLNACLNWAIDNEVWSGKNPADGIKAFAKVERDVWLGMDGNVAEVKRFFAALQAPETSDDLRDAIMLCILTVSRSGKIFGMAWENLDLERGRWKIPNPKGRQQGRNGETRSYYVGLVPEAVSILTRRKQTLTDGAASPWVFPSSKSLCASGHVTDVKYGWSDLCDRAGIDYHNLHIHDLRKTLPSIAAEEGESLLVLSKMLGHSSTQSTLIYARLGVAPVQAASERATNRLLATGDADRKALGAD